jgi:hypothetical protein
MKQLLAVCCPSVGPADKAVKSWLSTSAIKPVVTTLTDTEGEQAGFLSKLQHFHESQGDTEVLCYLHSDLFIHSRDWDQQLLDQFAEPSVGVVGFVGAGQLGHRDIYRTPYDYRQLARADVWSNLKDWQVHGQHLTEPRSVAVLDSCAIAVRRSLLDRIGGWQASGLPNSSHCSDLWICLMAARLGYLTRVIPVSCSHTGGGKGELGSKWLEARGGDELLHRQAHVVIYENFRNELPLRVKP